MVSILYEYESIFGDLATFEIEADVSRYYPAVVYGDPDRCHPAEGGEVEITSVTFISGNPSLQAEFEDELGQCNSLSESVDSLLFEASDPFDYSDWDDRHDCYSS